MSILLGLTGPTGSGKSSATEEAQKLGFKIVDCDILARKAVISGSAGLAALVGAFGEGILAADGSLDRKKLAAVAFACADSTELLNKTLLPHIVKLVNEEIDSDKVLLDAPTLFESGLDSICDAVIAVLADKNIRKDRIINRDGLTINEAKLRMKAGKPDEFYKTRTKYIIYNNGDRDRFCSEFNSLLQKIIGGTKNAGK